MDKKQDKCDSCRIILPGNKVFSCSFGSFKWLVIIGAVLIAALVAAAGYFGYNLYQLRSEQAEFEEYKKFKTEERASLQKMLTDNEKMLRDIAELSNLEKKLRRTLIYDVDNNKLSSAASGDEQEKAASAYLGQGSGRDMEDITALKGVLQAQNVNISQMIAERKNSVSKLLSELEGKGGTLASFPDLWPVKGGTVSSEYGSRSDPVEGGYEWHQGLDIAVDFGAPVFASAAGTVKQSGWNGGYGRYICIDHGNGYASAYGHMSGLAVSAGQKVAKGEIIGFVGSSGYSTGPHIHFEIMVDGQSVDPHYLLKEQ